jgi:hypothetical protein
VWGKASPGAPPLGMNWEAHFSRRGASSCRRCRFTHKEAAHGNVVIATAPIMDAANSDLRPKLLIRVIWGVRHLDDQERMFHAHVASVASCGHLTIGGGELRGIGGFDCCID